MIGFNTNKQKWKKVRKFLASNYAMVLLALIVFVVALVLQYVDAILNKEYESLPILICSCFIEYMKEAISITVCVGIIGKLVTNIFEARRSVKEEERRKIEPDKHLIIRNYINYDEDSESFKRVDSHQNKDFEKHIDYYDSTGELMTLHRINLKDAKKLKPDNKSIYNSKNETKKEQTAINNFINKNELNIASYNIFTNISGKTKFKVANDTGEYHPLDQFIESNRMKLLGAHSKKENNDTIRLDDLEYDVKRNNLMLKLSRTTYYDMLTTNRALDYELGETTLRKFYEYRDYPTPLKESKFSNQIGVNGIILTKDGYVLIEKRDLSKSTWRNKYGPPISFSLQEKYLVAKHGDKLDKNANIMNLILNAIKKSVKSNYSLIENEDYDQLKFETNFMGLARDMLEGGKPNIYFFIQLKKDVEEVIIDMQKYASLDKVDGSHEPIKDEKIDSVYYFVNYNDFVVDYYYNLYCKKDCTYNVGREYSPRIPKKDKSTDKVEKIKTDESREVAEGLLVCMFYLDTILEHGNKNQKRIIKDEKWEKKK